MPPRLQIRGHRGKPSDILPREPVLDLDAEILYVGTEDGLPVAISNQISLESRIAAMESEALKSSEVSVEVEPAKIVRRTGEGKVKSDLIGTADTAKALIVARRIRLTGAATGQAMFNGSSDVDIAVTVLDEMGNPLGNMSTTVYDQDGDGIVDVAKTVPWSGVTDKSGDLISTADQEKLDFIEAGAQVNVQSDWNAATGPAVILNKPSLAHNHDSTYEKVLGNPSADDYILTSKADGTRAWVQNSLQDAEGFFDIDVDGGLEPSLNPTVSSQYELDSNGDIMPKAVT